MEISELFYTFAYVLKLKKLTLVEGTRVLSNPEMKHLQGGVNYVFCHCKGNTGEGQEATSCSDCTNICGAGNVQNCNYVVG